MIFEVSHIVGLERYLFFLILGEMLSEKEPVQGVVALARALKAFLQKRKDLHCVFRLLIPAIAIHKVHGDVEGLVETLVITECIKVFAPPAIHVAKPH